MSEVTPEADIERRRFDVSYVPIADFARCREFWLFAASLI